MKKQVAAYIASLGGSSHYAGNTKVGNKTTKGELVIGSNKRTMFVNDPKKDMPIQSIEECVLNKFGFDLPFKLQTN